MSDACAMRKYGNYALWLPGNGVNERNVLAPKFTYLVSSEIESMEAGTVNRTRKEL